MFKNLKPDRLKIVKFHKKSLPELVRLVFRKLKSARVRLFIILAVFSIVPLYFSGCHDSILLQKLHD